MYPRACIVTTLVNADSVMDTFIRYHLEIGFEHMYLFLDDPNEKFYESAYLNKNVTFIRHDDNLKRHWEATNSYKFYSHFIQSEVMARQTLNVAVAIEMAIEAGYDWILHIDLDELFHLGRYGNVREHFQDMDRKGHSLIRYFNHEAIPEKLDIDNYFKEVTLFKRNFQTLNQDQKDILLCSGVTTKNYFRFYKNGKSAAKLKKDLEPNGVHLFSCDQDLHTDTNCCILHYPCCGIRHLLSKYTILGNFSDRWFGRDDIAKRLPTHIMARSVVQTGDLDLIKRFYKTLFMQQDIEQSKNLIEYNIYFRAFPLNIIVA